MRIKIAKALLGRLLTAASGAAIAAMATVAATPAQLARAPHADLIKDLSEGLNEIYVFPDVAEQMVKLINDNLERGKYDGLDT